MFSSAGPQQLLERASAYSSTNEATVAKVATLHRPQGRARLGRAAGAGRTGCPAQGDGQAQGGQDGRSSRPSRKAEQVASTAEQERHGLLVQLAEAKGTSVDDVTRDQDAIDEQLDESGPSTPPAARP